MYTNGHITTTQGHVNQRTHNCNIRTCTPTYTQLQHKDMLTNVHITTTQGHVNQRTHNYNTRTC